MGTSIGRWEPRPPDTTLINRKRQHYATASDEVAEQCDGIFTGQPYDDENEAVISWIGRDLLPGGLDLAQVPEKARPHIPQRMSKLRR